MKSNLTQPETARVNGRHTSSTAITDKCKTWWKRFFQIVTPTSWGTYLGNDRKLRFYSKEKQRAVRKPLRKKSDFKLLVFPQPGKTKFHHNRHPEPSPFPQRKRTLRQRIKLWWKNFWVIDEGYFDYDWDYSEGNDYRHPYLNGNLEEKSKKQAKETDDESLPNGGW